MNKKERIDKIVSNMGYGSRKEVKSYIRDGYITIDGQVIKDNKLRVNPYEVEIRINGELIRYREYIYLMLNKPQGFVSSTEDPLHRTVLELLFYEDLIFNPAPVGRLDLDTEGLLILTNDGKLNHDLTSPKKKVEKTYYLEYSGELDLDAVEKVKMGLILDDGYKTLPGELEIIDDSKAFIRIYEGKYHQVKRMIKALGAKVEYLKRVSMGGIDLDESLELGEYRELSTEEIEMLRGS